MSRKTLKMHYSVFGYRSACGKKIYTTRFLTRQDSDVTCKTCLSSLEKDNAR